MHKNRQRKIEDLEKDSEINKTLKEKYVLLFSFPKHYSHINYWGIKSRNIFSDLNTKNSLPRIFQINLETLAKCRERPGTLNLGLLP